jgi:CheY-like chemotaxis protein
MENERNEGSSDSLQLVVRAHGEPPRPLRALVVDDDDDFRSLMCGLLQRLGLETLEARHGHEAVYRVDEDHPDLLFLDHRMPGLLGAQIARSLHATGYRMPVVMITGGENVDEVAHEAGTSLRLAKPFSLVQLREMVLEAVGEHGCGPSPTQDEGAQEQRED